MSKKAAVKEPVKKEISRKQREYVAVYISNGGNKSAACKVVGCSMRSVLYWHKQKLFKAYVQEQEQQWFDALRAQLMKRAMEKSDTLGIFFLKSHNPELYDDAIRKLKYEAERGLSSEDRVVIEFTDWTQADGEEDSPARAVGKEVH